MSTPKVSTDWQEYWKVLREQRYHWAEKALDECKQFFVYGTLKRGSGNNHLLQRHSDRVTFIGETATVDDYHMFGIGVPVVTPYDDEGPYTKAPVRGEVYHVDYVPTVIDLDQLEGYPHGYNRMIIDTVDHGTAWIYYMNEAWGQQVPLTNGEYQW